MYGHYKKRLVTYVTKKYSDLIAEDVSKQGVKEAEVLRQIIKQYYDEKEKQTRQHSKA